MAAPVGCAPGLYRGGRRRTMAVARGGRGNALQPCLELERDVCVLCGVRRCTRESS